jgi:uroporphyrinogen decarboxylase
MTSTERVSLTLRHQARDRMPVYGWVKENMSGPICQAFGSVEAFEDHYGFDLAHLFGGPPSYVVGQEVLARSSRGEEVEPDEVLGLPLSDPNDSPAYDGLRSQVAHHKARDRFVYVQTPGFFEHWNGLFGIENHLGYLLTHTNEVELLYQKQADWNLQFAHNCLDIGIDCIHISDDWGGQNSLLFSPDLWMRLIYPNLKKVVDGVKARGGFVSIHSDGNINALKNHLVELGFDLVHPWQESAGMSLDDFDQNLRQSFTVMGGLDIQTTLGFGRLDLIRETLDRLIPQFQEGGLILCTTHFVQDHCSIEELVQTYDWIIQMNQPRGGGR